LFVSEPYHADPSVGVVLVYCFGLQLAYHLVPPDGGLYKSTSEYGLSSI
jgi:hypothetical protein